MAIALAENNVTTTALRDGEVYLLYSYLELLIGAGDASRETFEIVRVDFGEMDMDEMDGE